MSASAAGRTASDVGCSTQKPRHAGAVAVRSSGFPLGRRAPWPCAGSLRNDRM